MLLVVSLNPSIVNTGDTLTKEWAALMTSALDLHIFMSKSHHDKGLLLFLSTSLLQMEISCTCFGAG